MNITHIPLNISTTLLDPTAQCLNNNGVLSVECLNRLICPQLNNYFIKTGIWLVAIYIFVGWFLWWFMNYGYKLTEDTEVKYIGNMHDLKTRMYWDSWIRARMSILLLMYIVIVVWLNLNI